MQGSHFGSISSYITRAQLLVRQHPREEVGARAEGKFFVATDDDAVVKVCLMTRDV